MAIGDMRDTVKIRCRYEEVSPVFCEKRGQNIFLPKAFDDKPHNGRHNGELLTRSYDSDAVQA